MADGTEIYRDKEDFFRKLNESYEQIHPINSGGGGIIYAGIHRRLGQRVVLKKIRSNLVDVIGSQREMQILMNLKHTYLPRILDFWEYGDEIYTVMEFIEGRSFKELLDEGVKFSEKDAARWCRQLLEVLEYLHTSPEHIVHSDIKPANLMLTKEGNICLIDFNVSILLDGRADATIGYSESYAPVEQMIQIERAQRERAALRKESRTSANTLPGRAGETAGSARTVTLTAGGEETEVPDAGMDRTVTLTAGGEETEVPDAGMDRTVTLTADEEDTELMESGGMTGRPESPSVKPAPAGQPQAQSETVPIPLYVRAQAMERIYGDRLRVDFRSDIYSASATIYHILTGCMPQPCDRKQVPIEELLPSVNDAFARILMRGMEQDPKKRYQSATQMLAALRKMSKLTKSYRRLSLKQDLVFLILGAAFLASAGAAYFGWGMRVEAELTERLSTGQEYYISGQYEDGISYLEENVLENRLYRKSGQLSQGYYLEAVCQLELGAYQEAVNGFQKAIFLDNTRPEYYRDYGIALARSGDLAQARESLLQAKARNMKDSSLELLEGEIAALEGDNQAARAALEDCLMQSGDPDILVRACLKLDEVIKGEGGDGAYPERIRLLEGIRGKLPQEKSLLLLERLAQVYGDYGQEDGGSFYTEKAVETLEDIIDMGYGTLVEWLDCAVYLQSLGEYAEAEACLMKADALYPENYLIYKRLAFLMLEWPDYDKFDRYFQLGSRFYETDPNHGQDMEMEYLYQVYEEVVVNGWLE